MEERTHGSRAVARKEAMCKRNVAREKTEHGWTCIKTRHIAVWCREGGNTHVHAIGANDSENVEETLDNDEELQA